MSIKAALLSVLGLCGFSARLSPLEPTSLSWTTSLTESSLPRSARRQEDPGRGFQP